VGCLFTLVSYENEFTRRKLLSNSSGVSIYSRITAEEQKGMVFLFSSLSAQARCVNNVQCD